MTSRKTAGPRGRCGWTLLECLLVVAIMAMVFAATVPLLHSETAALDSTRPMVAKAQEVRFALAHVASALRQALPPYRRPARQAAAWLALRLRVWGPGREAREFLAAAVGQP